jgi:hypothetical protein
MPNDLRAHVICAAQLPATLAEGRFEVSMARGMGDRKAAIPSERGVSSSAYCLNGTRRDKPCPNRQNAVFGGVTTDVAVFLMV